MITKLIPITLCTFGISSLVAQRIDITKATSENIEWSEGVVYLSSGEELSGLLKLNTKTGILGFESGATSMSFTPRNVSAFEFFDVLQNKERKFISVVHEVHKVSSNNLNFTKDSRSSSVNIPQFFEILIEFHSFALLSSTGQMQVRAGTPSSGYYNPTTDTWTNGGGASTSYSQTETLFIFDADGNISPLLDITDTETDRLIFDSKKTSAKSHDNHLLEQYTTPYFGKIKTYAKENKLSFKKKDDLLKILEYYRQLSSN